MSLHEISFPSANGRDTIKAWAYSPLGKPRGVIQLIHGYGEDLYHVANLLANSGNKVAVKAYSGYRHEIHNELDIRDEVEAGLVAFVNGVLG